MDISKALPGTIVIETLSRPWNQSIEYEWIPKFRNNYIKLAHERRMLGLNMPQTGKQIRLN